ncbi:MAG: MFS superfamily sulfate permease-like transporter [Flammeovirgaceae bacterium]|jgi:MFS superfamily sulfate permease-like transporter
MSSENFEKDFITTRPNYLGSLKYDLPAGLVVFLVALPLCLGIALASGAPLFSGIIAGIVGGVIVGLFSGSPLGVSGPAAGLAAICVEAITGLGLEVFLVSVVISGVFQIGLGYAKAGIIGYYFPSAVIKGMLAGIGVLLILKQIPHALGNDIDFEGDDSFITESGNTFTDIIYAFQNYHKGAVTITIISVIILLLWQTNFFKKNPVLGLIPGPLLAVLTGSFLNIWFSSSSFLDIFGPDFILYNESQGAVQNNHLVTIPYFSTFKEFTGLFIFPDFASAFTNMNTTIMVLTTGATIAIVGSLETLLSVEAIDRLDQYKRITPTNRELKAQGIGNIISGMVGGLPVTQVIVRSSANINSKGKTKVSAIFHGALLLFCVYAIPNYLRFVPLSCLAAILLLVGYKLAGVSVFKQMYKKGLDQFIPFVVTIVAIVFTNLLYGIMIGMGVAIFYILRSNYRTPFYFQKEEHREGDKFTITLSEEVSFLNKASIMIMLEELPKNSEVTIDGRNANMIDKDVIEIIENFVYHAPLKNITLNVVGIEGIAQEEIERRIRMDADDREVFGGDLEE